MSQKEASDYIVECAGVGITGRSKICERARQRISEIDKLLHEADTLRIEKMKLTHVLNALGDESVKRRKVKVSPVTEQNLGGDDVEAQELRVKICSLIEQHPHGLTNRDIIQKVGSYQEDQKVVRALKFLGERGIIARDNTPERLIVPGSNWNVRPQ